VMSPAWEYHKGRSFPTYEEVKWTHKVPADTDTA
jgi:hypothetical protein